MIPALKPMPVARCSSCGWEFYVSVGFGSLGWHIVPQKCRCKRHYLVVVWVGLVTGCLKVRVAGVRQVHVAGAVGIERALSERPFAGMSPQDIETIVLTATLLARGGSEAA